VRLSLPLALAATALSSVLFGLAYPPYGLRPLAFVCLVPLLLALRSGGAGRALFLAWLWAVLSSWAVATVFPGSIAHYYARPLWFGLLAGMAIFSLMASLYYMVFALVDRVLVRHASLATPLLTAAAWVGAELGRGRLFTGTPFFIGNPWGLMGYTHASGALAQVASWAGVYGISFALVAVNAGLAGWIAARRDPGRSTRRAAFAAGLAALPAAAIAIGGSAALRAASDPSQTEGFVEVAVVQGNVALGRRWRSDYYGKNLDVYLALTRRALGEGSPRVVVWPEGAMTFFLETEAEYRRTVSSLLSEGDVELLAGGPSGGGDAQPPFFNSVFALSPDGSITARYDKEYLVPFSEYFPLVGLDLMQRRLDGARTFHHGASDPAPAETRLGRVGFLICNEAMLPEVARARVRAGAELLVSPSNDNWIAGEAFAEHMLAVVSLRAIEQHRYLLRASTSGPSAVVDPWGRTAVRTDPFTRGILRGLVRRETHETPYARWGDTFAGICVLAVVAGLAAGRRRSR
jgi:apolipoprotein N-acyltransferase